MSKKKDICEICSKNDAIARVTKPSTKGKKKKEEVKQNVCAECLAGQIRTQEEKQVKRRSSGVFSGMLSRRKNSVSKKSTTKEDDVSNGNDTHAPNESTPSKEISSEIQSLRDSLRVEKENVARLQAVIDQGVHDKATNDVDIDKATPQPNEKLVEAQITTIDHVEETNNSQSEPEVSNPATEKSSGWELFFECQERNPEAIGNEYAASKVPIDYSSFDSLSSLISYVKRAASTMLGENASIYDDVELDGAIVALLNVKLKEATEDELKIFFEEGGIEVISQGLRGLEAKLTQIRDDYGVGAGGGHILLGNLVRQLQLTSCFRTLLNNGGGIGAVLSSKGAVASFCSLALQTQNYLLRAAIFEILGALCLFSEEAAQTVDDSLNSAHKQCGSAKYSIVANAIRAASWLWECSRDSNSAIVSESDEDDMSGPGCVPELIVASMSLMNALVLSRRKATQRMNVRAAILGCAVAHSFDGALQRMQAIDANSHNALRLQISTFVQYTSKDSLQLFRGGITFTEMPSWLNNDTHDKNSASHVVFSLLRVLHYDVICGESLSTSDFEHLSTRLFALLQLSAVVASKESTIERNEEQQVSVGGESASSAPPPAPPTAPPPTPLTAPPTAPPTAPTAPPPNVGGVKKVKLRALRWTKHTRVEGTVWASLDATKLPIVNDNEITRLFDMSHAKKRAPITSSDYQSPFMNELRYERARMVLYRLDLLEKVPLIIAAVNGDLSALPLASADIAYLVHNALPTASEMSAMLDVESDVASDSDAVDQLCKLALTVPRFVEKGNVLAIRCDFAQRCVHAIAQLKLLHSACEQLSGSEALRSLLHMALHVGNAINTASNDRGNAVAITVSSLIALSETRSTSFGGRISVLDVATEMVVKHGTLVEAHNVDIQRVLFAVEGAAKLRVNELGRTCSTLFKEYDLVKAEIDACGAESAYAQALSTFVSTSTKYVEQLKEMIEALNKSANEVLTLFAATNDEDDLVLSQDLLEAKMDIAIQKLPSFLASLHVFGEAVHDAVPENASRVQSERSRAEIETTREMSEAKKRQQRQQSNNGADAPNGTANKNTSNASGGILDDMMSAIAGGKFGEALLARRKAVSDERDDEDSDDDWF